MKLMIIFTFLATIASCALIPSWRYRREPLTMLRENYLGKQVRTDGIYTYKNSSSKFSFFLYTNGIILREFCLDIASKNIDEVIEYLKVLPHNHPCQDIVYAGGVFKIEGSEIKIEKWMSGANWDTYYTRKYDGNIINDTTICINKWHTNGCDTFHFTALPVKPDSTNLFIK